jgi:hypothetical protein
VLFHWHCPQGLCKFTIFQNLKLGWILFLVIEKKLGQYLCMERQKAFMLLEIRIQTQATLVLIGFLMELHGQDIQMDDSLMDVTKLITLVCFVALNLHS